MMDQATRDAVREGAKQSAAAVLPIVLDHLGTPEAMLDVGTGEGWWCEAAAKLGVEHAWGLDVEPLTEGRGAYWNAEERVPLPTLNDGDRWPLSLCLEVAEHVTPAGGAFLLAELCRVSEVILWSAAIPGQGGDGHINEQWPCYWAEGFNSLGWVMLDPFRDKLWGCADVEPWYRQNLLLCVPQETVDVVGLEIPRALVDPVTWAHHRGVHPPERT